MDRPAWRRDSLFRRLLLLQVLLGLGYVLLFGAVFYAERNATVARLLADRWAPTLLALTGVPTRSGPTGPVPVLRDQRPPQAVTAPAFGPRLAVLDAALRERGVPLRSMAVAIGEGGPAFWLEVERPGGAPLWIGLPGDEILPLVPRRLLLGVGLGLGVLLLATGWFTRRLTRPLAQLRDNMLAQLPDAAATAVPSLAGRATPELHAIEAAFADLLARYRRHESERALLLAGVSHDLRSPLARIRMAADLLPEDGAVAVRRDSIVRNVKVADRLIESFLDHVRSGELPMAETVDLAALARTAAEQAERSPADLRVEIPASLLLLRANALLIVRMVANLLDNAFAHGEPPVVLRVLEHPDEAWIEVEDAGPGIDVSVRDSLLGAFARGDASRGKPGLGLGLAVVHRVAARLGGRVEFASRQSPGGGVVRIRLPRVR